MMRYKMVLAAVAAVGLLGVFADGEGITNGTLHVGVDGINGPFGWNDSRSWVDGDEPADGVGATAYVRIDGATPNRPTWVDFDRNVTLGHIIRPADDTQGASFSSREWLSCLLIRWDQLDRQVSDTYTPTTTSWGRRMSHYPVALTMDTGSPSTPATIQHLVPSETMSGKRFGMFIEPPIVLRSDLYVKYIGPSDRLYGGGWSSGNLGSFADGAVYLTGGISEGVAGRSVTVDNPVVSTTSSGSVYTPIFLGGTGAFTGPLNITSGMVRLLGEDRFESDCHSIGTNNHVYATTGAGVLDLAGTRAGLDGNTLHLGGLPVRSVMGTLINSVPDPLVPGEWTGPIVIESATRIGGYTQNPSGATVGGGDLVLSGPVSGSADVEIVNLRETVLAGDNSAFTGDWNLASGGFIRLRGENPIGQGKLLFKSWTEDTYYPTVGTGYRFGAADDADLTLFDEHYDISNQNFRIDVAAGLEYHPAKGFNDLAIENGNAALVKTGPGTLRLTEQSTVTGTKANTDWTYWLRIADGTVVLDYTENDMPKLIGSTSGGREGGVTFGERTRLEIRGTPATATGHFLYTVRPGCFGTLHLDDAGGSGDHGYQFCRGTFAGDWGSTAQGVMNIEADPAKWDIMTDIAYCGEQSQHDANYPSIRHPGEIWNGTTFTKRSASQKWKPNLWSYLIEPVPDSWYATDFETVSTNATATANSLVDVTAALCDAGTHADIECAALRFNTPNGTTPLVLNLSGTNRVHSGTILITANMGKTPVVIRGGRIIRDPLVNDATYGSSGLRIINMNTNATLTIESDLGADTATSDGTLVKGTLFFAGPGKTVFTGGFFGSGAIGVNGGTVSCGDGTKLLASCPTGFPQYNTTYQKYRQTFLYGGGLLEFTEDAPWACEVTGQTDPSSGKTYVNGWQPIIGVSGGGISVAKGKTLTIGDAWERHINFQQGATFIKAGEGTIDYGESVNWTVESYSVCTGGRLYDKVATIDLRGGTLARLADPAPNGIDATRPFFGGKSAVVVNAADGTSLVGVEFSTTRLTDCNRHPIDSGNGVRIVIPADATVTHDRHSTQDTGRPGETQFDALEFFPTGLRTGGLWAGAGTLVLTNSLGTKGMSWCGFKNRLFTGTIYDCLGTGDSTASDNNRYVGYVPVLENARLFLAADTKWYVGYGIDCDGTMRFRLGGLDGTGTFDCGSRWRNGLESPRLGSDDGLTHDFSGCLAITGAGGWYGQLTKVGSNTQRISGTANKLQTSARVVDGTLVLGHLRALDATDKLDTHNNIYVGGDETTAGMAPRFLVDCGDVTLTNTVRVLGCAGAASPAVGALAGTVTFRNVTVSNACTFVAEAGATAKFDTITQLGGTYPMSQTGAGTVELTTDFALSDSYALDWGGRLVVDGQLTVADGTKFALGSIPAELDPKLRYTLVSATGGITGRFDLSNVTLPSGWVLRQRANKLVLYRPSGIAVLVK